MSKRKQNAEKGDQVMVCPEDSIKATGQFAHFAGTIVNVRNTSLGQRVTVQCANGFRHTFDRNSIIMPLIND